MLAFSLMVRRLTKKWPYAFIRTDLRCSSWQHIPWWYLLREWYLSRHAGMGAGDLDVIKEFLAEEAAKPAGGISDDKCGAGFTEGQLLSAAASPLR